MYCQDKKDNEDDKRLVCNQEKLCLETIEMKASGRRQIAKKVLFVFNSF